MSNRIKSVLDEILRRFESGDIPKAIAISSFPIADIPSSKWSFLNRLVMYLSGTMDARGYRQWQKDKRYVKKGARAIHIIVPQMVKNHDQESDDETILKGFLAKPVFRYEDTAGQPIEHKTPPLPNLPLTDKAKEWGISVKAISGNYRFYGYYAPDKNEIGLASNEETIFFHELSHAAHYRATDAKNKDTWTKEIVAELSAAVLCEIVGKSSKHIGNSYRYIKRYAKDAGMTPTKACLKVISEVNSTLNLILEDPAEIPVL